VLAESVMLLKGEYELTMIYVDNKGRYLSLLTLVCLIASDIC